MNDLLSFIDPAPLERHPLSAAWGDMPSDLFRELAADVSRNGVRDPITLFDGKVLDGWHRVRAAKRHGLATVPVSPETPENPLHFVIQKNLFRRHLTKTQRATAVLLASEAHWSSHQDPTRMPIHARHFGNTVYTNPTIARLAGTSTSTITTCKRAIREGHGPALLAGTMTTTAYSKMLHARNHPHSPKRPPRPARDACGQCEALFHERRKAETATSRLAEARADVDRLTGLVSDLMDEKIARQA